MKFSRIFFDFFIINSHNYLAHLPKDSECNRQPERLSEHSALVCDYTNSLIKDLHLENIISNLISSAIPPNIKCEEIANAVEDLFYKAIAYHDLGKVNSEFQIKIMNNSSELLNVSHEFGSNHAIIGAYIYLADFICNIKKYNITDQSLIFMCNVALCFSYSICKHHASHLNCVQNPDFWNNDELLKLDSFLSLFKLDIEDGVLDMLHGLLNQATNERGCIFYEYNHSNLEDEFPLFALCKLNYSLLTASDYLATAHYMNNWSAPFSNNSLLDYSLKQKITQNITSYSYNKFIYEDLENGIDFDDNKFNETSNRNLNELRKFLAIEVINNVRKNHDNNLFYIEAPTGGGKTNLSMLAVAELLKADTNNSIDKIFYVFPFTTLITQTHDSLKATFGLEDFEIAEIHSKANYKENENESSDYLNYISNLMMNYPISLLSHIRFFDILKTNDKETNYLLHRLANSIVVIDEIQSYTPQMWDKVVYFIHNYAKYFNIKFIVMSATLPKIGNLINTNELKDSFVYLVKDKNKYFCNPNFCNRVSFDYSLLELGTPEKENRKEYLINLYNYLLLKSKEYASKNNDSVHTIIEFIFKKSASEFHSFASANNDFFDEIFLLSGSVLEPRRKEVISLLKSSKLRSQKVLLISTQVVEAGVDIDMDLGFKDKSIIDSEEQLAGRINRNVNKSQCTLYLFDYDKTKSIYGNDERYKIAKDLTSEEYRTILSKKNFDYLYDVVIKKIIAKNKSKYISNINDLKEYVKFCDYEKIDNELTLIKSANDSVFVPIDVPCSYFEKHYNILDEFYIPHNEFVRGKDVWDAYVNILLNRSDNFVSDKIKLKKLNSIMANFTFSIFRGGKDVDVIKSYCTNAEVTYGYYYLENFHDIYTFENGIDFKILDESSLL